MNDIQSLLTRSALTLLDISDSAELDVEVLLCHVLEKNRSYLRTWPEKRLTKTQLNQFTQLLEQRQQGQPIAYIIGNREFWSRDFFVDHNVLIPRPDTETLIELCLQLIQHKPDARLIDLGTGSGVIAITLAAECPQLNVTAVDNNIEALKVAQHNAQINHTPDIRFLHSHWLDQVKNESFDFIVSNPPYIAPTDPHLTQGDLRFEPESALIAEQHGLADIIHISKQSQQLLKKGGYLIFEHGYNQKQAVHDTLKQHQYQNIHCLHDLSNQPRISYAQWLTANQLQTTRMPNKTKEIAIPRKIVQNLLHHAQQTPEQEICGLISSLNNIPYRSYPIENTADKPERFFNLDPQQQIQAMAQMRENNEHLFAIYHSHPTAPAIPSSTDIEQASYPEALYIIISLDTKGILELRGYQLAESQFIEVALRLD